MIITLGLFYFLHRGEHFAHSHCEWGSSNGQVSPGQWGWCTRESMWKFLLPRWSEELSYGYLRPWMGWCDWKNKLWGVSLNRKNYTLHFLCLDLSIKKKNSDRSNILSSWIMQFHNGAWSWKQLTLIIWWENFIAKGDWASNTMN